MTPSPTPKVSRRPRIPLIWVVPIVAVLVAAWLLSREWRNHGNEIEIVFADGAGVEAGRTELQYKGVPVGMVQEVELLPDFSGVRVLLQLDRSTGDLAREGSRFWIVHPEINFSGISGIEALVGGVHIEVRPGDGPPAPSFRGLDKAPVPEATEQGPAFLLRIERLGNLHPGAPVLFRDIRVGSVETSQLSPDATAALIRVRLRAPYAALVRTNSKFWNAGGLPLHISLFGGGGKSSSGSLQSLLSGAIGFATPDEPGPVAGDGTEFKLYSEVDKEWLDWRPQITILPEETSPDTTPPPTSLPEILNTGKAAAE